MNAFAHAMFDQLRQPDQDVRFIMRIVGGPAMTCSCRDFLHLRPEEESLIRICLENRKAPRILDIGSGIGRHSIFSSSQSEGAIVTFVEINQRLRAHCLHSVQGSVAFSEFADVPTDARFDLAFLMGGGLGVFGNELSTRQQIQRLFNFMVPGGSVLIESGNFTRGDFYEARHEIEYNGVVDGPFSWGYATHQWLERVLVEVGFSVVPLTLSSRGSPFFIIPATRPL